MLLFEFIILYIKVMIDDLRAVAIFAETIKQGSFRGAAKKFGLSPSVISYHITQLETHLGVALIYRSTRKLSLTSEGEMLYRYACDMLDSVERGLSEVSSKGLNPTGKLSVSVPSSLTKGSISKRIASFSKLNPGIDLHIAYTDSRQDLIANGIDLALRAGDMDDSSLLSKQIGHISRTLVCSPDYAATQVAVTCPDDLTSWNWIKHTMLPPCRTLHKEGVQAVKVKFNSTVSVNSVEAMTQLAIHGVGLSTPPSIFVEQALDEGTLLEILPDWYVEPIPLHAVWPNNVLQGSNAKRLLNHLIEA